MRIVLLGPLRSSFVQTDIEELGHAHTITAIDTVLGRGLSGAWNLVLLTMKACAAVVSANVLYCWFADYHTLIPTVFARLLGKRVIVIAGGYDVGYLPEINYGARMRPKRWFCTKNTFRFASVVLPVSEYAGRQLELLTNGKHAPATVVYNGVLTERFPASLPHAPREPLAITVSQGDTETEYVRKGLDRFIAVAKRVPEMSFVIIGPVGAALERAKREATNVKNVTIVPGFVSLVDEIIPAYQRAACYCQFSIEETFGMAVAEAMLCGAIPVTTNGGALPEVTGPAGLRSNDLEELAQLVRSTLTADIKVRLAAREQALTFQASHRGAALRRIVG